MRHIAMILLVAGALLAAPAVTAIPAVTAAPASAVAGPHRPAGFGIGSAPPADPVARAKASLAAGEPAGSRRRSERTGRKEASSSRLKALGASLLLPGLGHRTVGSPGRARGFMLAEAALLIGIVANEAQGYVRKQGYIEYAEDFAGVADAGGQPDWYYRNLGVYGSSDDYAADVARTARALYGDDLAAREAYVAQNRPAPDRSWQWSSEAERREYRERRKESRNAYRRASLFIGAALFNRLLSGVDAARLAGKPRGGGSVEVRTDDSGAPYLCLAWSLH